MLFGAATGLAACALGSSLHAQTAAPITVTPQSLAPARAEGGLDVAIPETGALSPPAGAENLAVTLDGVEVTGAFPEVQRAVDSITATLRARRVTLREIYAAASEIEAAHARAGFVLARVSVPPQNLRDGGVLKIVVTDGFVERVDTANLPPRIRTAVEARVAGLAGRRHITLAEIEQPLLLASDLPGVALRSTLTRGDQPGATRIVLDGNQKPVSGSFGVDNGLDASLGRWQGSLQLALNGLLGAGEQVYGFVGADRFVGHWFDDRAKVRVLGGGAIVPIGDGRLTLNPEYVYSRTAPDPAPGAPVSIGTLERVSLRLGFTLARSSRRSIVLNGTVEQLAERNRLPQFALDLSHDRYLVGRFGLSWSAQSPRGLGYGMSLQLSQGLGGRSAADVASSGVGYSRVGAGNGFTKLVGQGRATLPMTKAIDVSFVARGQTGFSKPLLRSEQFPLEGSDSASAYVGGIGAVDEGITGRLELGTRAGLGAGATLAPYLFGAGGAGSIARPTVLEPGSLRLASIGAGARLNLRSVGISLGLEYAHGFASLARLDNRDRVNVTTTIRF